MGKEDIEGFWLDVVKEHNDIIGCGYINIYYEDGMYVIEGDVYDRNAVKQGKFKTNLSNYNKKEFSYKYGYLGEYDEGIKTGHGLHSFHGDGGKVWNYEGYFHEDKNEKVFYAEGIRLRTYLKSDHGQSRVKNKNNRNAFERVHLAEKDI